MSYHDNQSLYSNKASLKNLINQNSQEWTRFQRLLNIPTISEQDKARYAARCNQLREQVKQDQARLSQIQLRIQRDEEERRNEIARHEQMMQAHQAEIENKRALQLLFQGSQ
jgi:hypothetical protein